MKRPSAKTIGIFLLKLLGTILFLWWAFSRIEDKQALAENFSLALRSPTWVATGLALAFLSQVAAAYRWYFLLRAQDIHQPFLYILRLTFYAAFFNIASFGGAAGDAAKIVLLIRREPEKKIGVTVSVMIDHVIGFIAASIIFLVFTWAFNTIDASNEAAAKQTFVAATWFQVAGLVGFGLSVLSCTPWMLARGRKFFPKITDNRWVDSITTALDIYRTKWIYAVWSLLASFVLAATFYLTFWVGLRTLDQEIPAATIMAVMPVVDVITALPISISGLGVRESTFDFLLSRLTGIPTSAAVAASLIGFLFNLFWGIFGGLAIITATQRKDNSANSTDV
ncbi:MAG: lysylphosphatidylglycerol synthase transmembrane domain-containing protein [Luteolibacter sp.]